MKNLNTILLQTFLILSLTAVQTMAQQSTEVNQAAFDANKRASLLTLSAFFNVEADSKSESSGGNWNPEKGSAQMLLATVEDRLLSEYLNMRLQLNPCTSVVTKQKFDLVFSAYRLSDAVVKLLEPETRNCLKLYLQAETPN